MPSVLLFANPIAGRGRGARLAAALAHRLAENGYRVRPILENPQTLADEHLTAETYDAALVIGGDGTLRAVVQRLLQSVGPDRLPPILPVPLGTANLMSKHLGLRPAPGTLDRQILSTLARREIVQLDAAVANDQLFLLMAGVGIDGQIVHEVDRMRRGPIDLTSYALPAALALKDFRAVPITVQIDAHARFGPAPGLAVVGNVAEYGTGFPILPHAKSDDGLLDVCILPCANRFDLLRLLLLATTGDHLSAPGVIYTTARRVSITAGEPIPVQIDGDAAGTTPLNIEMLATTIPFLRAEKM